MKAQTNRRGFALPIVLWLVVVMGGMAAVAALTAREAVGAATNRVGLARARWLAEGCSHFIRGELAEWMVRSADAASLWATIDSAALTTPAECDVQLKPAGMTPDVNNLNEAQLARTLSLVGLSEAAAGSLAAAIIDWRDADDVARPLGAESQWYFESRMPLARNNPFAAPEELKLVKGADAFPDIDLRFGTDDDPVLLTRAPPFALIGLPGMGDEGVAAILSARNEPDFPDLAVIAERLSEPARLELLASLPALRQLTTAKPLAWILTATARAPVEGIEASIELRLARDNRRLAIVRRRTWP
ncbi:MAG: general secretion pathway protein GspK [Gemmatimonadaceae bacterium]